MCELKCPKVYIIQQNNIKLIFIEIKCSHLYKMNYINCYKPFWWVLFTTGNIIAVFALVLYCTNNKINSAICAFISGCIIMMCMLSWCLLSVGNQIHREIHYSDDEYSVTTYTIDISQTSNVTEISESSNIPAIIV